MKLLVSSSPHMQTRTTTTAVLMRDVVIALIPALISSVWIFGLRSLLVTAVSVAVAVLTEYLFEKAVGRDVTVSDFSAVVTGMLLAFNLPVTIPLWQAALGSIVAILVVKQLLAASAGTLPTPPSWGLLSQSPCVGGGDGLGQGVGRQQLRRSRPRGRARPRRLAVLSGPGRRFR